MLDQPPYVLLIAVALALVLPEPGRWNPFVLAQSGARTLARDLPKSGPWAVSAGILVLGLVAAPAVAATWALTSALPVALRLVSPDASPIVALILAAVVLRLTLRLPPIWRRQEDTERPQRAPVQTLGAELAAPVMLFALLGIYAPVVCRIALEISRGFADARESECIAAPATALAYIPAYPAGRLVELFCLLADRSGISAATSKSYPLCARAVAALATIALALLVTIW
jgi:hypothetical protein